MTNTTLHTYSTAHTYQLHSHPWICGMPLTGLRSCLKRGRRRWRLSRDEGSGDSTLHRMGSGSTPPPQRRKKQARGESVEAAKNLDEKHRSSLEWIGSNDIS